MAAIRQKHLPSLDGIRGFGVMAVFVVHYTFGLAAVPKDLSLPKTLYLLWCQTAWVAVPIFFVLSGFLITGILYDTRDRESFFRVFYIRRGLRVLPMYYFVLAVGALVMLIAGLKFSWLQMLYVVYLHNLFWDPKTSAELWGVYQVSHIWSLCVEEQFYLVWPVVIWFIRDRRKLLIFCYAVIAGVEVVRLAWPLMHLPYQLAYESTVTRCDALMMGALLALKKRGPVESFRSWIWPARITVAVVLAFVLARALLVGQALPYDAFGLAVLMPLMNLMAMAIVVLTIEPSTWMSRICSYPAAVRLGVLTYSVYLIHMPLLPLFATRVMPWLAQRTGSWFVGRLLGTAIAMVVTYTLASLTYRYIELPVQELKSRFRYGGPKSQHPHVIRFKRAVRETVLGEAAAEDGHAAMERRAAQERQPVQERHPAKEQRTA